MGSEDYVGTFDLSRLETRVLNALDIRQKLYEALATIGQVGGCLFLVHLVWKTFIKMSNIHHLYVRRKTSFKFAWRTSFYKEQAVVNLIMAGRDENLDMEGHDKARELEA